MVTCEGDATTPWSNQTSPQPIPPNFLAKLRFRLPEKPKIKKFKFATDVTIQLWKTWSPLRDPELHPEGA